MSETPTCTLSGCQGQVTSVRVLDCENMCVCAVQRSNTHMKTAAQPVRYEQARPQELDKWEHELFPDVFGIYFYFSGKIVKTAAAPCASQRKQRSAAAVAAASAVVHSRLPPQPHTLPTRTDARFTTNIPHIATDLSGTPCLSVVRKTPPFLPATTEQREVATTARASSPFQPFQQNRDTKHTWSQPRVRKQHILLLELYIYIKSTQ